MKRPNVQVGDPFLEKLLLEACIEAMKTGAIVAIQDMGAAEVSRRRPARWEAAAALVSTSISTLSRKARNRDDGL